LLFDVSAATAQDGAALYASICSKCHNDVNHPKAVVYNAAGNVAIIEAVNAFGMGATGSLADHTAIATYLDSVKPTINMAPVAHDSPTIINLYDIIVSAAEQHADWQIIANIVTVSPPAKGTVSYRFANGFALPSLATYTPFPGQSGIDTWTYQGIGQLGTTTIRTASVNIAPASSLTINYQGLWFNPAEAGWGINFAHQGDTIFASWYTYDLSGKPTWLVMTANKTTGNTYTGQLFQGTGPAFDSVPFPPLGSPGGAVVGGLGGTATVTFTDANNAMFTYTVTGAASQAKAITRQLF
jgi:hypothetical protein